MAGAGTGGGGGSGGVPVPATAEPGTSANQSNGKPINHLDYRLIEQGINLNEI